MKAEARRNAAREVFSGKVPGRGSKASQATLANGGTSTFIVSIEFTGR